MSDCILRWDVPLTSDQAARYLLTTGFVAVELYNETLRRSQQPVDLLLFCPKCQKQHVDEAKPDVCETCGQSESQCPCDAFTAWLNPPHKSHRCTSCNYVWRPADVPTNGVKEIQTKGKADRDASPYPCVVGQMGASVILKDGAKISIERGENADNAHVYLVIRPVEHVNIASIPA
jgi:hypothetical protein